MGSGPLTKLGAGLLVLNGNNAYGATTVERGYAPTRRRQRAGQRSLDDLRGRAANQRIQRGRRGPVASGQIQNGSLSLASSLTVGSDNTNTTYTGTFSNGSSGSLTIVKTGSGG